MTHSNYEQPCGVAKAGCAYVKEINEIGPVARTISVQTPIQIELLIHGTIICPLPSFFFELGVWSGSLWTNACGQHNDMVCIVPFACVR